MGKQLLTQFELSGTLQVTILETSPAGQLFSAGGLDKKLTSPRAELDQGFQAASSELGKPFFLLLAPDGSIPATYFTEDASGLALGILQSVAASLQAPRTVPKDKLVRREHDATGADEVEYTPTSELRRALRKKLRYLDAPSGATVAARLPVTPHAVVAASSGEVWLGSGTLPERSDSEELIRTSAGTSEPIEVATKLSLRQLRVERATDREVSQALELLKQAHEPANTSSLQDSSPAMDRARIAGRSLTQVLAAIRAHELVPRPEGKDAQAEYDRVGRDAYSALEALIRMQPETAGVLAAHIRRKDSLSTLLIDALGSAGAAQGHETLGALLQEGVLDATGARVATIALSRTPWPTAASIAVLQKLLADPKQGTQALLGLGTTVRRLGEQGDDARAGQLLALVIERLNSATDDATRVTALRAIANSANARAFDKVVPFFSNERPEIRVAAVEAVRLMQHPEVDARLASAMQDPRVEVRLAAVEAPRRRTPTDELLTGVRAAAQSDRDAHVRLAAVKTLVEWLPAKPELRGPLAQIAKADAVEDVKQAARANLGRSP